MGTQPYIIRQGDFWTGLAHRHGFEAEEVWSGDANREIRGRRANPDQLHPGDIVYLPTEPLAGQSVRARQKNAFRARVPATSVHIVLHDTDGPLANEPYRLEGLGEVREGTTDTDGNVTIEMPITATEVSLVLWRRHTVYPIRLGHLDPIEEVSGVRQRLEHLGFHGFRTVRTSDINADEQDWDAVAVRAFQRAHRLPITGVVDTATRDATRTAHRT